MVLNISKDTIEMKQNTGCSTKQIRRKNGIKNMTKTALTKQRIVQICTKTVRFWPLCVREKAGQNDVASAFFSTQTHLFCHGKSNRLLYMKWRRAMIKIDFMVNFLFSKVKKYVAFHSSNFLKYKSKLNASRAKFQRRISKSSGLWSYLLQLCLRDHSRKKVKKM